MSEDEALFDVQPLPPFSSISDAVRVALSALAPLSRIKVSEAAPDRSAEVGGYWQAWRPDAAPYMVEPMDVTTSRRFDSIVFGGPARSLKSEGLVLNPLNHAIQAQPRMVAVFSPNKDAAKEWSEGTLDKLILNSPKLKALLATGRGSDNIFTKRFRGGTRLTVDWPVPSKLAQRSISLVIGTDYDAFPDDIGGDGAAFGLMRKRTESAGSRAMTIIESSPRKPILDEMWRAKTAHEMPPCEGIVTLYNQGSRGRLYWSCPDCDHEFEPRFDRLHVPSEGSPDERGGRVYMACPNCGSVIESRMKAELNAGARWLHEEEDGSLAPLDELVRETATASYWLPGPAAALAPWSRIASRLLQAEEEFNRTGAEGNLKAVTNTELGLPYLPRARSVSEGLHADVLKEAATDDAWREAPETTRFITAAVDVQKGRFVVQVEAWGDDLERVVIDRFDIIEPPVGAPNSDGRAINPARYGEDWGALFDLAEKSYPVVGGDYALGILAVTCDAAGEPGVTPNAYSFYRTARMTHPNRFYLIRGRGGEMAKRAELRRPETAHQGKRHVARDVPIIRAGTDRLKDEVAASLLRDADGARKLSISRFAPPEIFEEYAAERRGDKGWQKRPGVQRNEALDLSVYALALVIILEAEAIDPENPPTWALATSGNLMATTLDADAVQTAPKRSSGWSVKRAKKR